MFNVFDQTPPKTSVEWTKCRCEVIFICTIIRNIGKVRHQTWPPFLLPWYGSFVLKTKVRFWPNLLIYSSAAPGEAEKGDFASSPPPNPPGSDTDPNNCFVRAVQKIVSVVKWVFEDFQLRHLVWIKFIFLFQSASMTVLYPFLNLHMKSLGLTITEVRKI